MGAKGHASAFSLLCGIVLATTVVTASAPAAHQATAAHKIWPTATYIVRGIDQVDHRLFVEDTTYGALRQSDDWGTTFSKNKGFPQGVATMGKILLFKGKLFMVGLDSASGQRGVYVATPTPGDEPLVWSGPTHTIIPPARFLPTDFDADSHFLYLGEYGDPVGGPNLFRSSDGTHWERVLGPVAGARHIHAVAPDPYHPGDVWMAIGDGVPLSIWRSHRYGAPGSWHVVVASSQWQSVQISFSRTSVFLAADTHSQTFFVINRRTLRPRLGTPQYFQSVQPQGGPPSTQYLWNAFYGAVDPTTGIYYCVANDESGLGKPNSGSWQGFFAVRRIGGPVSILDPGGPNRNMNGEVFVGGGRIWSGQWWITALR